MFARTDGRDHGQVSLIGIYTITSDPENIVYVPVGLGGIDGLPNGGGPVGLGDSGGLPNGGEPVGLGGSDGLTNGAEPVGLGGSDGLPNGAEPSWVGLGDDATELTSALFAMMNAVSAPSLWKTVPTKPLKWQFPLL